MAEISQLTNSEKPRCLLACKNHILCLKTAQVIAIKLCGDCGGSLSQLCTGKEEKKREAKGNGRKQVKRERRVRQKTSIGKIA